jgi:hypothetical protein
MRMAWVASNSTVQWQSSGTEAICLFVNIIDVYRVFLMVKPYRVTAEILDSDVCSASEHVDHVNLIRAFRIGR